MSLERILKEVEGCKELINQDLSLVDLRARTYKVGQINSAKERLEGLYIDYKNEMLKKSVFILVAGKGSGEFTKIAEEKFGCFSLDGKDFYKGIVAELSPQVYVNKTVNASVFDILGNILEDKMKPLDIITYNSLMFDIKYGKVVKDADEMTEVLVQAINDIVGPEVIALDALEKVARRAVNEGYSRKLVPIILHSEDEKFINDIHLDIRKINSKAVIVSAGKAKKNPDAFVSLKKVTEESVGEALKKIAAKA